MKLKHKSLLVTQGCDWQGNGLVIHRSQVRVLAGYHHVVALGKQLTPVCLCQERKGWNRGKGSVCYRSLPVAMRLAAKT